MMQRQVDDEHLQTFEGNFKKRSMTLPLESVSLN